MRKEEFKNWMQQQERFYKGKWGPYSESAINSRIVCLESLERYFDIDLDEVATDIVMGVDFLMEIRSANIEDLSHTPLSNAFRHYFKFATNLYIDRIF